jgi:hypothetical protein
MRSLPRSTLAIAAALLTVACGSSRDDNGDEDSGLLSCTIGEICAHLKSSSCGMTGKPVAECPTDPTALCLALPAGWGGLPWTDTYFYEGTKLVCGSTITLTMFESLCTENHGILAFATDQ